MAMMPTEPRWTGAVIGLGRVGMGYDYACTDGSRILSHAQAFRHHPRFTLAGGVDPDPERRRLFAAKFNIPAFATAAELFAAVQVDVVALATPTPAHVDSFQAIRPFPWKLILCEKPIALTLEEARVMVEWTSASGRVMAVNYMRRTEPGAETVREMIGSGGLGEVFKGTVWYSKGMLNNGSHFVDLLIHWLGEVRQIRPLSPGRSWNGTDPEPDVKITFGGTDVYFLAGREEVYNVAEIELHGTEGKLHYGRSGHEIFCWRRAPDPANPGFTPLTGVPDVIPNDADRFQFHVLEQLSAVLDGRIREPASSGRTALHTLETVLKAVAR